MESNDTCHRSRATWRWHRHLQGLHEPAKKKVPYSYTLEYDRTLTPARQLRGNLKLLRSTLYNVARHGKFPGR